MSLREVNAAPSKWFSFQGAGEMWGKVLATRALVLANLCMDKGWIVTEEDLFASTRLGVDSNCGDKPAPKSKACAVESARAKLNKLKERTGNTLSTAARLCADVDVVNGIRIILHATKAQWSGFTDMPLKLTSPEQCL